MQFVIEEHFGEHIVFAETSRGGRAMLAVYLDRADAQEFVDWLVAGNICRRSDANSCG